MCAASSVRTGVSHHTAHTPQRGARLELGVVHDNIDALGLYRRLGFVPTGTEIGAHSGDQLTRMRFSEGDS